MVIQCPSCGTKFSVEVEELSGTRNPTFHCSRCNHFFDLKGKRRSLPINRSEDVVAESSDDKQEKQLSLLSEELLSEPAEWSSRTGMVDILDTSGERKEVPPEELPLVTAEWPDTRTDREIEVDLSEVTRRTTPFAKVPVAKLDLQERKPVLTPRISEPAFVAKPAARAFHEPRLGVAEREEPTTKGELLKFPHSSAAQLTAPSSSAQKRDLFSGWTKGIGSLGTAISVPILCAVVLWGTSLSTVPALLLSSGELGVVPPNGMELNSLTSSVRTLVDGRQAVEIIGKITNSTPRTYNSPQIIVRGYDQQNLKLAEQILPAVNGIQNTDNLQALRAETLMRLQSEQGLIRELKPGESLQFRAALLIDGTAPSYFDARVYSVQRSS